MRPKLREATPVSSIEQIKVYPAKGRGAGRVVRIQSVKYEPPSLEARALRALRERLQFSQSFAADAIGLREKDLRDLEDGRLVFEEPKNWQRSGEALVRAKDSLETRSAS